MNKLIKVLITIFIVSFSYNGFYAHASKKRLLDSLTPKEIYDKSYYIGDFYNNDYGKDIRKIRCGEEEAFLIPVAKLYGTDNHYFSYLLVDSKDIDRFNSFLELLKVLSVNYNKKGTIDFRKLINKKNCLFGDIIAVNKYYEPFGVDAKRFNLKGLYPFAFEDGTVIGVCYDIKDYPKATAIIGIDGYFGLKESDILHTQEVIEASIQSDDTTLNPESINRIGKFSTEMSYDGSSSVFSYKNNIYIEGDDCVGYGYTKARSYLWLKKENLLSFIEWLKAVKIQCEDWSTRIPPRMSSLDDDWSEKTCGGDVLDLGGVIAIKFDSKMEVIMGEKFDKEKGIHVGIFPGAKNPKYTINIGLFYLHYSDYRQIDELINLLEAIDTETE